MKRSVDNTKNAEEELLLQRDTLLNTSHDWFDIPITPDVELDGADFEITIDVDDDALGAQSSAPEMAQYAPGRIDREIVHAQLADLWMPGAAGHFVNKEEPFIALAETVVATDDLQNVFLTSAEDSDGKTTSAIKLATLLGQLWGARVLLMEANFQAPAIATALGMDPALCFAYQLATREADDQPLWVSHIHSLSIDVLAIRRDFDATSYGATYEAFYSCLCQASDAGYDYIVIDGPSALGAFDITPFMEMCDGVAMVARVGKTNGVSVRQAAEALRPYRMISTVVLKG